MLQFHHSFESAFKFTIISIPLSSFVVFLPLGMYAFHVCVKIVVLAAVFPAKLYLLTWSNKSELKQVLLLLYFYCLSLDAMQGLCIHFPAKVMMEIGSPYKLFALITLLIAVQTESFLRKRVLHTW